MFKYLYGSWINDFREWVRTSSEEIYIISPFITSKGASHLLNSNESKTDIKIITRLNDNDLLNKVNDLKALVKLHKAGVRIKVHDSKLHTKLYLFDNMTAFITSSNLTGSGLNGNSELGVCISSREKTKEIRNYFNNLWDSLDHELSLDRLKEISDHISKLKMSYSGREILPPGLMDHGSPGIKTNKQDFPILNLQDTNELIFESNSNHWCKFLWRRDNPASSEMDIQKIAHRQGAVTFPKNPGIPHVFEIGDYIYHTALTNSSKGRDWIVFGRSEVAILHRPNIDEAPLEFRREIPALDKYPYCMWLCNAEFIASKLSNGVSLHTLFNKYGDGTFIWSKNEANAGRPNREKEAIRYYRSHIELTIEAAKHLNYELAASFNKYGSIKIPSGNDIWWNDIISKKMPGKEFKRAPVN